jgi:transglutaminase-like putative cysteine protease
MQFQMWVTGRQWCDWISFDPRAPEAMQLHVYRVERDQEYIGELVARVEYLEQCVQEQMKLIQEKLK